VAGTLPLQYAGNKYNLANLQCGGGAWRFRHYRCYRLVRCQRAHIGYTEATL
jgi:hypothetical protein